MIDRIRRRTEIDGCACLECRGVSSVVVRRGIGDVFLWALRVLPTRPSVVLVFLALAAVQFVGRIGSIRLELAAALVSFGGGLFAYSYTVALVAGECTERRYAPTTAAAYTLRRLPTVIGTMVLWLGAIVLLLTGLFLVGLYALLTDGLLFTVGAILVLLVLFVLFVLVSVKFVLAQEAAIVGGYGVIDSFRVSWGLVSFRRRTVLLLVSLVTLIVTGFLVGELGTITAPYPVVGNETVRLAAFGLSTVTTYLSSAVSAFVLCHLYVQSVLEFE